jgi:YHS domain-containing protein
MRKTTLILILLFAVTTREYAQSSQVVTVLTGLDPVALVDGKEAKGLENLAVVRGRYRYLFSTPDNKSLFERSPDLYQIQLGGGCGRMGPLSGAGSPDRFYVHDRKIYIFASEGCRNGFKAAPELHIDKPDPPPQGSQADKKRAAALLDRALAGFGGARRVDALTSYQASLKITYLQGTTKTEGDRVYSIEFPDRYRQEEKWGDSKFADLLLPEMAVTISSSGTWIREEQVRAALEREFYRQPLAILKSRRDPKFSAVASGSGKVGDVDVEFVDVGFKGATTRLAIDQQSGHILQIAYRGRNGSIGEIVRTFSDFKEVDGLMLPFKIEDSFNGKPIANPTIRYTSVTLNAKLNEELFQKPKKY